MKKHLLAIAITSAAVLQANAANVGYLSGGSAPWDNGDEPWGVSSNVDAMNAAFGAGNWARQNWGSFDLTGLSFLFIDGSDWNDDDFASFMTANSSALETWVYNGNRLILNAARQDNDGELYLGFNVTVDRDPLSSQGWATGAHPIFDASTGTSWTGTFFAHDIVADHPYQTLIQSEIGNPILVEGSWGDGLVMIGGLTTPNFHSPQDAAFNLRVNMLEYMTDGLEIEVQQPVPEVQHYAAMLGAVLAGAEMLRRRRTV